jgi:hypothetical protein
LENRAGPPGGEVPAAGAGPVRSGWSTLTATPLPPGIHPGTWFEIFRGEQRARRRLKLSAILADTGEVLFTTRTGEEALTLPLPRFLEDLREGRSRPIEDTNRFEEALQAVIRSRDAGD